jgi:hypothetical protein
MKRRTTMNPLLRDLGYGLRMLLTPISFAAAASLALDLKTPVSRDQAPFCRVFSRPIGGAEAGKRLFTDLGRGDFAALVKRVTQSGSGGPAGAGRSEQWPEPLDRKPGILDDLARREGVDRVVPWNHHDPHAVAHDRMPALADDLEPRFLQRANGGLMIDPGQFGPGPSDGDHLAGNPGPQTGRQLRARLELFADRVADVGQRLLARGALAATAGEVVTPDGEALFGFNQCHRVIHGLSVLDRAGLSNC